MADQITTESIYDETSEEPKKLLADYFTGFDPTTMPEPEMKTDLKRKRLKITNRIPELTEDDLKHEDRTSITL